MKIFGAYQLYHFISMLVLTLFQIVSSAMGTRTFFDPGLAFANQQVEQETVNLAARPRPASFYLIFDRSTSMVQATKTGRPLELGRQITHSFIKEVLQEDDKFGFLILEDNVPQQLEGVQPVGFDIIPFVNEITLKLGYDEVDEGPCTLYQAIDAAISTLAAEQNSAIIVITDGDKKRTTSCSQTERDSVAVRARKQHVPLFMFLIGDTSGEEEVEMVNQSEGGLISISLSHKPWNAVIEAPPTAVAGMFKLIQEIRPEQLEPDPSTEPLLQFQTEEGDITRLSNTNEWTFNIKTQNIDNADDLIAFVNDQPIQAFTFNLVEEKLVVSLDQAPIVKDPGDEPHLLEIRLTTPEGQQPLDNILIAQGDESSVLEPFLPNMVLLAVQDTPISMMWPTVGVSGLILLIVAYRVHHKPVPQPFVSNPTRYPNTKTRMPSDLTRADFLDAQLIYVSGAEQEDTPIKFSSLKIEGPVVKIGRSEEGPEPYTPGEIYINLPGETTISRPVHAEITLNLVERQFYIVDHSSTIIRVSGKIIEKDKREPLFHNTSIHIGGLEFRFELDEEFERNVPARDDGNDITRPLENPNQ